jgi:hypothetical protein
MMLLAVMAAVALAGCSLLATVSEDRNQLAVQYATLKVLERADVDAARVIELVDRAEQYVEAGTEVAVATLVDAARERLAESSLSPADRMLVEAILGRAQERLEAEVGDGLLAGEQRLQLLTVLGWIEDAARGHTVQP